MKTIGASVMCSKQSITRDERQVEDGPDWTGWFSHPALITSRPGRHSLPVIKFTVSVLSVLRSAIILGLRSVRTVGSAQQCLVSILQWPGRHPDIIPLITARLSVSHQGRQTD